MYIRILVYININILYIYLADVTVGVSVDFLELFLRTLVELAREDLFRGSVRGLVRGLVQGLGLYKGLSWRERVWSEV